VIGLVCSDARPACRWPSSAIAGASTTARSSPATRPRSADGGRSRTSDGSSTSPVRRSGSARSTSSSTGS